MKKPFRSAFYQVHLWVGLAVSLVFVIAALTGAILAFRPELDVLIHRRLLRVPPGVQRVSVDAAVAAVEAARPGNRAKFVRFPPGPAATYEVHVEDRIQVYVNPYTGEVLGARDRDGGFLGSIDKLHRFLLAGSGGKAVVDACTAASVFVLLSGLYLWWPTTRRMLAAVSKLNWRLRGQGFWLNCHMVVGLYAALLLVVSSATALPVGYAWMKDALFVLTRSAPVKPPRSEASRGRARISLEAAWQLAHAKVPEFREALLRVPVGERDPMDFYFIAADAPNSEARSTVYIDAYSGALLRYTPHSEQSAGLKAFYLMKSIHLAQFGGRFGQVPLALSMLCVPLLAASGAWIFYLRKFSPAVRSAAKKRSTSGAIPGPAQAGSPAR